MQVRPPTSSLPVACLPRRSVGDSVVSGQSRRPALSRSESQRARTALRRSAPGGGARFPASGGEQRRGGAQWREGPDPTE